MASRTSACARPTYEGAGTRAVRYAAPRARARLYRVILLGERHGMGEVGDDGLLRAHLVRAPVILEKEIACEKSRERWRARARAFGISESPRILLLQMQVFWEL